MSKVAKPTALVEAPNDLEAVMKSALQAAELRDAEVRAAGAKTLVGQISAKDWAGWDASDEIAIASGDASDLDDDCDVTVAA